MKITVDFARKTGRVIKPLHGINNSPINLSSPITEYAEAGIPFVRLHDTGGRFGGNIFVDIPNVFRDFDADENDAANYDFTFTDAYLKQLNASGCQIFYRLGVTIENDYRVKAYRISPPKDFAKWARICEHVIRHYNEGWADGMHLGITYWEIWNEPENPSMWSGTREQFYQFYKTAATFLKKCFPNLKIGGYASCGFYDLTVSDCSDFYKSFVPWFTEFLDFAQAEKVPLDFLSWHRYIEVPEVLQVEAKFVRDELDKHGFTQAESIFDEWNYINGTLSPWDDLKEAPAAAVVAKTFIMLQRLPVDKAMYYQGRPMSTYAGIYYYPSERLTPVYYAFKAFNALYQLKQEVFTEVEAGGPAVLASAEGNHAAILIANTDATTCWNEMEILNSPDCEPVATLIDSHHCFERIPYRPNIPIPLHSVLLLEYNATSTKSASPIDDTKFAGLGD